MRSYSAILICGIASVVSAHTVSAQGGSQVAPAPAAVTPTTVPANPAIVYVDGKPVGAAEAWSAKPVGNYYLVIPTGESMMVANLTISENAGKLTATLVPAEDPDPVPLDVAVNGTDLVLRLNRPDHPITMHLNRRGSQLSGNWSLGTEQSGTLEGTAKP